MTFAGLACRGAGQPCFFYSPAGPEPPLWQGPRWAYAPFSPGRAGTTAFRRNAQPAPAGGCSKGLGCYPNEQNQTSGDSAGGLVRAFVGPNALLAQDRTPRLVRSLPLVFASKIMIAKRKFLFHFLKGCAIMYAACFDRPIRQFSEVNEVEMSYKPLWKLLIDRDMTKGQLREMAGISTRQLAKMGKGEDVSTDVLRKICDVLGCNLNDIIEMTNGSPEQSTPNDQ